MKKVRDFVSKGDSVRLAAQESEVADCAPPLSSASHPSDLPRDYGMAGEVGAYEVKPLAQVVAQTLNEFTEAFRLHSDAERVVCAALDELLSGDERHRVAVERVTEGLVTLSLARKHDRFLYARTLLPKLKAALMPQLGVVRIQLMDR